MLANFKISLIAVSLVINWVHADTYISVPKAQYEIIAKTLLPHLEENLRNTITKEKRCLDEIEINTLFPILMHPSFNQCGLSTLINADNIYELGCENSDAASGRAILEIENDRFSANLKIKMGAKNMTMTQTVIATKVNDC